MDGSFDFPVNCPVCGAENPASSNFCGLCLHYFGSTYSKGIIDPPKWYSASSYKMVYSEGSFLTGQLKNLEREIEEGAAKKGGHGAYINKQIENGPRDIRRTAWV